MKLLKNSHYPNLWDTNGRRGDWIQALDTYTTILNNLEGDWERYPKSLIQYEFYKSALSKSSHVLTKHDPYDMFEAALDDLNLRQDFENRSLDCSLYKQEAWFQKLDNGIEDRARHYTSNLASFGLASPSREISSVGKQFIGELETSQDVIEQLLPFHNRTNILVLFRQVLKIRIWKDEIWFSPAMLLLLLLCSIGTFDKQKAARMIECGFTLCQHGDMPTLISLIKSGNFDAAYDFALKQTLFHNIDMPSNISTMSDKEYFSLDAFKNGKKAGQTKTYQTFVLLLEQFIQNPKVYSFKEFIDFYQINKDALNKRFGDGKSVFNTLGKNGKDYMAFLASNKNNPLLSATNTRQNIFAAAARSVNMDRIYENASQIEKLFVMSDMTSTNNGQMGSDYTDIYKIINDYVNFASLIYGNGKVEDYEGKIEGSFYQSLSLIEILGISEEQAVAIKSRIVNEIGDENELKEKFIHQQNNRLVYLAENVFTPSKLVELLPLFYDRKNNDKRIIDAVGGDCDAPTALEYLCGMSMYHLLGGAFSLSKAFNMALNGDGYPVRFAGGNQADIVIEHEQENTIGVVELTLMDPVSQEKGETIPVFKHTKQIQEAYPQHGHWTWFIAPEISDISQIVWASLNQTEGTNIMPMTIRELVSKLNTIC